MSTRLSYNQTFNNEQPGADGRMIFTVDEMSGVIRVESSGFWSVDQIKNFFNSYNACIHRLHSKNIKIVSICDLRGAMAQSQAVTDLLSTSIEGVYQNGDRVAMIVANSLVKLQMRRILDKTYHEFFLSMTAGETWAMANRPTAATANRLLTIAS